MINQSENQKLSDLITQVQQNGKAQESIKHHQDQIGQQQLKKRVNQHRNRFFLFLSQICQCFQPSIQQQAQFNEEKLANLPPISQENFKKKTLVIDLDETLVHSTFKPSQIVDIVIQVEIEGRWLSVYVQKRPGVDEFLAKLAPFYELIIFTASLGKYADPLIDQLDTKKLCDYRLFRESCTLSQGQYVKDLSLLGRNLKDVIILDNSPSSYKFQPENAIPVKS